MVAPPGAADAGSDSGPAEPLPVAVVLGPSHSGASTLQSVGRSAGRASILGVGAAEPAQATVLRVPVTMGRDYLGLRRDIRQLDLVTVCEEAGCPNIYECWADGTATFMINGSRCTRACGFCPVDTRHPLRLDVSEPGRVAEAVARMGVRHAVITCVARDDLADGGGDRISPKPSPLSGGVPPSRRWRC